MPCKPRALWKFLKERKPRSATAQTLEDTILIGITATHFIQVMRANFDIALCIMSELSQWLRDTNLYVFDLTFLDARTRVIKNLIQLANKHSIRNGTTIRIKLNLNYDELNQLAGVQNNVLVQVIRDLQDHGIIKLGRSDFTLDLNKLR